MSAHGFDRADALRRLAEETFDVCVVGGGITGVGVALDAASRGLRTALVERDDFASGTSSKSSKLVHGGLRYLQQREFRLVYEALAERQVLRHTAPHLVRVLPFLIPVLTRDGLMNAKLARALGSAMWMYDLTGGLRIGKLHKRISADQAEAHMPTLPRDRLAAGYLYYDAQADDARLTLAVARTAAIDHGAVVVNRAGLVGLHKDASGAIVAADVDAGGERIRIRTRSVVNAAGVWADRVRTLDEGRDPDTIRPAKGIHITVPWQRIRNDIAVVVPVPSDKRSIFVVPWGDLTYIGTTDTDYDGSLDDPQCTPDDVAYLLRAMNHSLTEPISEADVVGTWAGLRPLVKSAATAKTADLSRRHAVSRSAGGLITVTGGKLTTYRRMAADTVDLIVDGLGRGGRSRTRKVRLRGAEGWETIEAEGPSRLGLPPDLARHLASRYGSEARVIAAMLQADPALGAALVPGLPYVRAEAVYAARYEMSGSLDDVLSRRTRARLLARDASAAVADDVARLIAPDLGWSDADVAREVAAYRASVGAERRAGGLPESALDAAIGA
ncbi:MAG: glycerol-3-phosphate dehydrogenase/oxidase [Acidimicrobiales bacterium]|nr:glycerol-3-phosphate dehydrogenase/oxidase [Acidimicrobiales bacterium]